MSRMGGFLQRFWHQARLKHFVVFTPALTPDATIRDKDGRPLIRVFNQETFQRPDAVYTCSCGKEWY